MIDPITPRQFVIHFIEQSQGPLGEFDETPVAAGTTFQQRDQRSGDASLEMHPIDCPWFFFVGRVRMSRFGRYDEEFAGRDLVTRPADGDIPPSFMAVDQD